jgi:hypothetical protein
MADIHISLSLLEGPPRISKGDFETSYGGFTFDTALQYVAVRRVIFGVGSGKNKQSGTVRGRRDMEFLFTWLHRKGVRNIIKVIVDDRPVPSHSDESIEAALKDLDIEILDWSKVDMCPKTIQVACPTVRELHLWWSGNNGMLRSWSEPDGLAQLPRLTDIHLHQTQVSRKQIPT